MLNQYLQKQLAKARYKLLQDGTYWGEIPGVSGVWAKATTLEKCREELREVLEDWLFLKIRDREMVPGLRIRVDKRKLVKNA